MDWPITATPLTHEHEVTCEWNLRAILQGFGCYMAIFYFVCAEAASSERSVKILIRTPLVYASL